MTYREIPELPGVSYFDCTKLHASLQASACAGMWRKANEPRSERYTACRSCALGAAHAGVSNASSSPIRGALVCGRCVRGTTRLIFGKICVSCYNREREVIKGRNARGAAPVRAARLAPRSVFYAANGRTHTLREERTASPAELIVATMRDSLHSVRFSFRAPRIGLRQLRLF